MSENKKVFVSLNEIALELIDPQAKALLHLKNQFKCAVCGEVHSIGKGGYAKCVKEVLKTEGSAYGGGVPREIYGKKGEFYARVPEPLKYFWKEGNIDWIVILPSTLKPELALMLGKGGIQALVKKYYARALKILNEVKKTLEEKNKVILRKIVRHYGLQEKYEWLIDAGDPDVFYKIWWDLLGREDVPLRMKESLSIGLIMSILGREIEITSTRLQLIISRGSPFRYFLTNPEITWFDLERRAIEVSVRGYPLVLDVKNGKILPEKGLGKELSRLFYGEKHSKEDQNHQDLLA